MTRETVEYVFVMRDGSSHHQRVADLADAHKVAKKHDAIAYGLSENKPEIVASVMQSKQVGQTPKH